MPRGGGTAAPDGVVLRQLADTAGDPLRQAGAMKGQCLDPRLMKAVREAGGHCVYLPEIWCEEEDRQSLEALALDIAAASRAVVPHRTQKRLQIFAEDLKDSQVFPPLVGRMLAAFGGLSFVDAWVNVYRDGWETTGAHQDHYNLRKPFAGATLNLNLGATRHLCCEHMVTGDKYYVPQVNGSLFAFDAKFNCAFRHSVPPERSLGAEPASLRLSITVFAMQGPQPASVTRDVDNVPSGVPLTADWTDWNFSDLGWCSTKCLPAGIGATRLLECGPLMRGHQKGGKGSKNSKGDKGGRGDKGGKGGRCGEGGKDGKGNYSKGTLDVPVDTNADRGGSSPPRDEHFPSNGDAQGSSVAAPKRRWQRSSKFSER